MFILPPVEGTKIILNPECEYYDRYKNQARGGAGRIVSIDASTLKNWDEYRPQDIKQTSCYVQWDNGGKFDYYLRDLLPVESDVTSFMRVKTTDGDDLYGTWEELEPRLTEKLIQKGYAIHRKTETTQKYLDTLYGGLYRKYKARIGAGKELSEFHGSVFQELIRLGYAEKEEQMLETLTAYTGTGLSPLADPPTPSGILDLLEAVPLPTPRTIEEVAEAVRERRRPVRPRRIAEADDIEWIDGDSDDRF